MKVHHREIAVTSKALIVLTAKPAAKRRLIDEATQLATRFLRHMRATTPTPRAAVMARMRPDLFALASPPPRHDVTIELCADAESSAFTDALAGAGDRLPSASQRPGDAVVLLGTDLVFRPCPPQTVRFQYLMRRRRDLTHEDFARHYRDIHSEFGFRTKGVVGYAQFHVDPHLSARAVTAFDLGSCDVDGVSQLHMPALTKFFLAAPINAAQGMVSDEKRFVDRANSTMSVYKVVARPH